MITRQQIGLLAAIALVVVSSTIAAWFILNKPAVQGSAKNRPRVPGCKERVVWPEEPFTLQKGEKVCAAPNIVITIDKMVESNNPFTAVHENAGWRVDLLFQQKNLTWSVDADGQYSERPAGKTVPYLYNIIGTDGTSYATITLFEVT